MDKKSLTIMTHLVTKVIDLEIKSKVLTDTLVKSGTITVEELREKYKLIEEKDFANTRDELLESLSKIPE